MNAHTPGPQKFSRADLTARLRKLEARELPKPILVNTSISLHSDTNACIAGFVMGGGFTLEVAQEIARRCNAHEDLLEALEAMIRPLTRTWVDGPPITHPAHDAYRHASAAIAKARGQS